MKINDMAKGMFVALTAATLVLAGCGKHSGSPSNSNGSGAGGDTTCEAFLAQDKDGKNATIERFLSWGGQSTSKSNILATRLSAEAFCRTTGKGKLVKNIETG